jgi:hypothetical protein
MSRKRLYWPVLLALTMVLGLVLATVPASADNLQNDAATTAGITTITTGDSTTITYKLIGNAAPGGDPTGCDATGSKPVTVAINRPAGVSGTPVSLSFTGCGDANTKTATFSSLTAGSYNITHSISGGVSGSLFNNQANFTLTVNAPTPTNTAPTLTLSADKTAEATGPGGATVTYTVSANDAEDGALTPSCSPASGSTFPLGVTQVNCSVTDSGLLTTSGMFNVTVVDTTPPTLQLPANVTKEATGSDGAAVSFSATASDSVDGAVSINCTPASGSTFPLGTTTVTCSATDAHGNTASGSFDVTVVDTTPPTLHLADVSTQATGNSQATVSYTATATDLVDGSVPVSCSPASGSSFPAGTTTVSCSATDAHNNTAHGTFNVTVYYGWTGFFQPVDNLPTVNTVKAGSAIPVKFSLSGNQGLNIFKSGSPASASYTCSGTAPTDAIEQTLTAGNSSLSYDATTDQYTYVWKTDKGWAGSCRTLVVKLADNTTVKTANFQLTK